VCSSVGLFPSFVFYQPLTVFPFIYVQEILTTSFLSSCPLLPPLIAKPSNLYACFLNFTQNESSQLFMDLTYFCYLLSSRAANVLFRQCFLLPVLLKWSLPSNLIKCNFSYKWFICDNRSVSFQILTKRFPQLLNLKVLLTLAYTVTP